MSVLQVEGLEGQTSGSLGGGGVEGGLQDSLRILSPSLCDSAALRFILPRFHQRGGLGGRDPGSSPEGRGRACSSALQGLLQPHVRCDEGVRGLEADYRSVSPQSSCGEDQVPDGDFSISPAFHPRRRLDVLDRPEGCIPSGSYASGQSALSLVFGRRQGLAVQGPLLRSHHSSLCLHAGHGSYLSLPAPARDTNSALPRRLADSGFVEDESIWSTDQVLSILFYVFEFSKSLEFSFI